jgi:hypothetical protein
VRISNEPEERKKEERKKQRKKERKNAIYSGLLRLCQQLYMSY